MTRSRSAGDSVSGWAAGPAGRLRGPAAPRPLERQIEALRVHWLQEIVDGVDRERVNRVLVEGRDEDELRQRLRLHESPGDFEPVQPRHLHVEEEQVRLQFAAEAQRLHAVGRLRDDLDAAGLAEEEAQLLPRQLFIIHHERAQGVCRHAVARSGATSSGISMRADVPSPATLCSLSS